MEKKRIPVRPHHGMCLAYFIGKGYSEGFSAHMEKMLHILEQDVPIRLVVSLDEICSACPNHQVTVEASGEEKEICEAQEKVYRYDHGVLDACGLAEGEEMNFLEFTRKVQEKVIDTGLREKICGDCQWNSICSEKGSRWENKNILR